MTKRSGLCFLTILTLTISLFSCKPIQNVYYTKDLIDSNKVVTIPQISIPIALIQPYDLLQITFYGKGLDMTTMMNNFGGLETGQKFASSTNEALRPGFLVSPDGFIELPQLGKVKVAGMSLSQLKADLTQRASKLMVEPTVIVKFTTFKVSMLGEVAVRGQVTSQSEKMTIFEALGLCGDITIFGLKDKVKVIRTQDTTTTVGNIDLTSKDIFKSEYFYLKPNDVVYVPTNGLQQKQIRTNTYLPFVSVGLSLVSILIALRVIR